MFLCSDEQLLDDAGWAGFADGRARHSARSALLPRFDDTAAALVAVSANAAGAAQPQLPGSYAESLTSPVQPSPQGPYDTHWLRCNGDAALRHAAADTPLSVRQCWLLLQPFWKCGLLCLWFSPCFYITISVEYFSLVLLWCGHCLFLCFFVLSLLWCLTRACLK